MSSNEIVAFVYCLVAIVSAFILIYTARTIAVITPRYSDAKYVFWAILFSGIASVFDCAYTLRELEVFSFSQTSSYIFTLIYVISISLCGTFWVWYSEKKQNSWSVKTKTSFILYALPLILSLILIVSTPFTHVYFYFEDTHYQRGPLFLVLSTILFMYVIQTGVVALSRSFRKENYVNRKDYRRLFAFAVVYLVIQIIQLTLPSVFPYRSVGTMLFFIVFLVQNMQEMIGRDPLTHINNRFAAERQFGIMFSGSDKFEIYMLDLDKFKTINDRFGHQEGDRALQYVAEALKNSVDSSCFIARMGGDEFLVINRDIDSSVADFEDRVNQSIEKILEKQNCKYRFTISAGQAVRDDGVNSIPDLIAIADGNLYLRKTEKKTLRE